MMLISGVSTSRADVISTFDTGLDGWSGLASDGPTTQYTWGSTGGNPGGYFDFVDQAPTAGTITAPSSFLGNWSALNNVGTFSWDQILFSTGGDPNSYGPFEVDIAGPGGAASFTSATNDTAVGSWITITAPIVSSDWTVTTGTWAGLLANVTSVNLDIEDVTNVHTPSVGDPGDHDGIDNVILHGPSITPEPSSLVLVGVGGLMALGLRNRRRRSRAAA